jgi:hypothetical protein
LEYILGAPMRLQKEVREEVLEHALHGMESGGPSW